MAKSCILVATCAILLTLTQSVRVSANVALDDFSGRDIAAVPSKKLLDDVLDKELPVISDEDFQQRKEIYSVRMGVANQFEPALDAVETSEEPEASSEPEGDAVTGIEGFEDNDFEVEGSPEEMVEESSEPEVHVYPRMEEEEPTESPMEIVGQDEFSGMSLEAF